MRILFFGDVVGASAVQALATRIQKWREEFGIDLVIANAENAEVSHPENLYRGFGITPQIVDTLLSSGVDVITGGNHSWDAPSADQAHAHPQVIRPLNVTDSLSGKGTITVTVQGELVTIMNLMGSSAAKPRGYSTTSPLEVFHQQSIPTGSKVIIDFHSESVMEKMAFAHSVDGQATAVLGTHTHEPSQLMHRLPKKTLLVTEVGMNGPSGGVIGMDAEAFKELWQKPISLPFALAKGPLQLGAVVLDLDGDTHQLSRFQPFDWIGIVPGLTL